MDIQMFTQLIGSLGFPIVCCGALFWKVNDQDKKHKEEMQTIQKAIDNNTEAITALTVIVKQHLNE